MKELIEVYACYTLSDANNTQRYYHQIGIKTYTEEFVYDFETYYLVKRIDNDELLKNVMKL